MANFGKQPQPYRVQWPITPAQAENIDQMFEMLFLRISQLQQGLKITASSAESAIALATGLIGDGDRDGNESGMLSQPGPPGLQGLLGATGPTMFLPSEAPDESALIAIPGPIGATGATGAAGSGSGTPIISAFEDNSLEGFDMLRPGMDPAAYIGASAYQNGASQSLNDATFTALTFDTNVYDSGGIHDTASNTSRFTVPPGGTGLYLLNCSGLFEANATGQRIIAAGLNGTSPGTSVTIRGGGFFAGNPSGTWAQAVICTVLQPLVAGDYVEFYGYQNAGVARIIYGTGAYYAVRAGIHKIG